MRVLCDHGVPAPLIPFPAGHTVTTAAEAAQFDVFVTTDKNMRYQQSLAGRNIAVIILGKQQWPDVRPYVQRVVDAVNAATPASYAAFSSTVAPITSRCGHHGTMAVPDALYLTDAAVARDYLESRRWPQGPVCPHCASARAARLSSPLVRPGLWKCGACRRQFTVTIHTLFEDTKLPLHKWLQALVLLSSSPRGSSARELQRALGLPYKTAWTLLDRLRYAFHRSRCPESPTAASRPESLYPRSLDAIVDRLLQTIPERKHPQALERAVLKHHRVKAVVVAGD